MKKKILILLLVVLTLTFVAQIYATANAVSLRLYCCCVRWTYDDYAQRYVCIQQRCGTDPSWGCAPVF